MGRSKKEVFSSILQGIKEIKIQGARNVAKAALKAYNLDPSKKSKKLLLSSRPTEPMMFRVLQMADSYSENEILNHFDSSQKKINENVLKIISNGDRIFTHCHSTNVINALIYAKKQGKKFEVYSTETRPLFQGRLTLKELKKAGIKVTMFIDSAAGIAIEKENNEDKIYANKVFLGADAITSQGVINKIGSGLISEIASSHKIPVYIIADSWKYTKSKVPIEQRKITEVWDKAPKNVKIKNPAFELVKKKYIKSIVSELGVLNYSDFTRKAK